jgi:hypothetical protein
MNALSKQEFDIGGLINNDELFKLARHKLVCYQTDNHKLKKLTDIMFEHGNTISAIIRIDKELAIYAMYIANHEAKWFINNSHKNHESLKEEQCIL